MEKGNPPPYDPYGGMGPPPPQAFQVGGGPPPMNPHPGQQQPYPPQNYGGGGTSVIINPGMAGITTQPVVTTTPVVYVGGCPTCRVGVMQESYGCCAIFLAIFFFPIGILCCLAMREKRCSNCGATFG